MGRKKMKLELVNLSFSYGKKTLFENLNAVLEGGGRPLVILGPSGSGKTTLLKLFGGLLKPQTGEIRFLDDGKRSEAFPKTAFMFQEPRLLPWLTVLENISLPLEKDFGREEARARARHFISQVSLEEKEASYPHELSGGQAQRVSMARAFAWPAPVLLMDEPFQSLDIPLRINLMDLTLSLLASEKRLVIAVTHDPREAVYMGGRIIILGGAGEGIIFDRIIDLNPEERTYGSSTAGELERELICVMR
jgi:NitT/TauT family transport system ATP-binding protein